MYNSQKKIEKKKISHFFRNIRKIYRATNFGKSISMATTPWFCIHSTRFISLWNSFIGIFCELNWIEL